MSFNFSLASWQGVAVIVLLMLACVVVSLCRRVARVYVRLLGTGGQADGASLRAALLMTLRSQPRAFRLALQAIVNRRPGTLALAARHVLAVLPPAVSLSLVIHVHGVAPQTLAVALAGTMLLILAHIDARCGLLPDALTLPLLWLGLATAWAGWGAVSLHDALAGAMGGYAVLWVLAWCFRVWRKAEGMGYGDLKLLAALGAWVGWQVLPWLLLAACLAGIAFAMWQQRRWLPTGAYPFGPFLAAAGAGVFMVTTGVHLCIYG